MDESSDEALVARVVATGDTAAFETLVRRHQSKVRNWLRQLTRDPARADDLAQETFIRAFARLSEFRGEAALSTWLGSIAISIALNGLRKVRRLRDREVALDDVPPMGRMTPEAEPDLKVRLAQAIDGLPDGYRVVFVMHDVEGYTHEEIATSLGVHPGTSKAQLFRARARLRDALADFAKE